MSYDDTDRNRRYPANGDPSGPADGIHPSVEILSEYLDQASELAQAERDAIDHHLAGCGQCQQALTELRLMVRTLGSLPERELPRSFTLTPAMLEPAKRPEPPAPIVLQESAQWHERHAGKLRWATAVAAMLFVFAISADLVTNNFAGSDDSAPAEGDMEVMMAQESTPAAATQSEAAEDARTLDDEVPASEEAAPASGEGSAAKEVPEPESDAATAGDEPEVSTYLEPSDDADAGSEADDEAAVLTMEQEEISGEPAAEARASDDAGLTRWRIAQVSLALVLAVLLAVMIGVPRQRGRRR